MSLTILNASQNHYVRGGSDRYFFAMADLLAAHGHRVIPFCSAQPQNDPSPWAGSFPPGVEFGSPGWRDVARFVASLPARRAVQRLIDEHRPDVAHLHIYYGQLTATILAPLRAAGIPIVQTLHDFKLVCPVYSLLSHGHICQACHGRKFWKATLKRCNHDSLPRSLLSTVESYVSRRLGAVAKVDRFIAVSDFQRNKHIELGVPADRITTVHNFIDAAGIAPTVTPGEYFLFFGRVDRLKGVATLLEAAAAVPNVPLLIAGTGHAQDEVAATIEKRGLGHVHPLGFKQPEELGQLIRGSIATLVPSVGYDNCPMSILESFAYARPVIGSRIGGIPELIDDGQDGFVVDPGDAVALAERLQWMADHRQESVAMGVRAREKVDARFHPEAHYGKIMDVYRRVGIASEADEVPIPAETTL